MKYVLFIVTSTDRVGTTDVKTGYEFSEVADPYFEFNIEGIAIDFASPAGGAPPESSYDPMHKNSVDLRGGSGFLRLGFSHKLDAINIEAYDAIFFPGGLGPMVDLVDAPEVKEIVRQAFENGVVVGAVCHGPAALLNVLLSNQRFLVDGKNVSCFTEAEEKASKHYMPEVIPFLLDKAVQEQGARISYGETFAPHVVVDGRLVTGQNPASASFVAKEMIKLMKTGAAL